MLVALFVVVDKVSIWGQSSGGTSVWALMMAPSAKGLFHKGWSLSGSPIFNKTLTDARRENGQAFLQPNSTIRSKCPQVTAECLMNIRLVTLSWCKIIGVLIHVLFLIRLFIYIYIYLRYWVPCNSQTVTHTIIYNLGEVMFFTTVIPITIATHAIETNWSATHNISSQHSFYISGMGSITGHQ